VQNAEQQSPSSIWSSIYKRLEAKPIDELYVAYSKGWFDTLEVDKDLEPELYEFVELVKNDSPRFNNYSKDKLTYFARRVYELRKDNSNNAS